MFRHFYFISKYLLLFPLLMAPPGLQAQIKLLRPDSVQRDSSRIKVYEKKESAWLYTSATGTKFTIGPLKVSPDVSFRPQLTSNYGLSVGGGFQYRFLTLAYGFLLPGTLQKQDDNARASQFTLAQTKSNFKVEVSYMKINGLLYLLPDSNGSLTPVHQFGDIRYRSYGGAFSYFFNYKRFSYRAANLCAEQQTRSAGSIIASVAASYQVLHSRDSALINSGYTYKTDSGDLAPIYIIVNRFSSKKIALTGEIGYSYNFVLNKGKWNFNPMLSLIIGTDHTVTALPAETGDLPSFTFVRGLCWNMNISYNTPDFYVLLHYKGQNATTGILPVPNSSIHINSFNFEVGYRFRKYSKKIGGIL